MTNFRELLIALCLLAPGVVAHGQNASRDSIALADQQAEVVRNAVEQVRDSLVQIRFIGEFRGVSRNASGVSTGALLDRQWVVTSGFGLEKHPKVVLVVLPTGEKVSAAIVGQDKGRNIALLRLAKPINEAPPPFEARSDPSPGETAVAVGAAYSPTQPNVSVGIVSATGRFLGRAVQSDAATSPANYGGLLVDLHGRVLGVVTPLGQESGSLGAQLYDSGIGFAIPMSDILDRLPAMQEGGEIQPGKAGVTLVAGNAYADLPTISKLAPEGPGAVAGLKQGDVVRKVGDVPVATQKQFQVALGPYDAGDMVRLELLRGEETVTLELKLVAASDLKQPEKALPNLLQRLKLNLPKAD